MKLIEDWRGAWRLYSMRSLAAITMAPIVWAELPPDIKSLVPPEWTPWILSGLALSGMIGRVIDQGSEH